VSVASYETTLLLVVPTVEIALTWAASSTPLSASSVTVADCPTFTLLMSDSLKATVIVIVPVFTISANAEPLDEPLDELEPPRLPALVPPAPPDEELDEEELELLEPEEVDPADTESPG
jgi:hypothetical protein